MKTTQQAVAYLPATTVLAELNRMVQEVGAVGVSADSTTMGGSFEAWSAELERGQTAWLYTLEAFGSITELMGYCDSMQQRGVVVRSVREGWFNDPKLSGTEMLGHLFRLGEAIHHRLSETTSLFARRGADRNDQGLLGIMVNKAQKAVELRATRQLSVVSACRLADCSVNAYYRYVKQHQG